MFRLQFAGFVPEMVFRMTKLSLFRLFSERGTGLARRSDVCAWLRAHPRQRVAKGEIDIPDGLLTIQ